MCGRGTRCRMRSFRPARRLTPCCWEQWVCRTSAGTRSRRRHSNRATARKPGPRSRLCGMEARSTCSWRPKIACARVMAEESIGIVLVDGHLYGFNNSILVCLEFATGKLLWRHRSVGKGAVTYADGHLYILSENHVVGLFAGFQYGF